MGQTAVLLIIGVKFFLSLLLLKDVIAETKAQDYWIYVVTGCLSAKKLYHTGIDYIDCADFKIKLCPVKYMFDYETKECSKYYSNSDPSFWKLSPESKKFNKYVKNIKKLQGEYKKAKKTCEIGNLFGVGLKTIPSRYYYCQGDCVLHCENNTMFVINICVTKEKYNEYQKVLKHCEKQKQLKNDIMTNRYVKSKTRDGFYECQPYGAQPIYNKCPEPYKFNIKTDLCEGEGPLKCGETIRDNPPPFTWHKTKLTYAIYNYTDKITLPVIRGSLKAAIHEYEKRTILRFKEVNPSDNPDLKVICASTGVGAIAFAGTPEDPIITIGTDNTNMYPLRKGISYNELLRSILLHELGHVVGLDHRREPNSVVSVCGNKSGYNTRLYDRDVAEINKRYGKGGVLEQALRAKKKGLKFYKVRDDFVIIFRGDKFINNDCPYSFDKTGCEIEAAKLS